MWRPPIRFVFAVKAIPSAIGRHACVLYMLLRIRRAHGIAARVYSNPDLEGLRLSSVSRTSPAKINRRRSLLISGWPVRLLGREDGVHIPGGDDIMKMHTYVNFAGKCAEAFRFYEKHLGGTISMMMTHGQAPDQSHVSPDWKDAVLHARISLG